MTVVTSRKKQIGHPKKFALIGGIVSDLILLLAPAIIPTLGHITEDRSKRIGNCARDDW